MVTPDKASIFLSIRLVAADAGPRSGSVLIAVMRVDDSGKQRGEALSVRVPEFLEYLD